MAGGGGKLELMYMTRCALILHSFTIEHIHASGMDLIGVVSPRMLKWDASGVC